MDQFGTVRTRDRSQLKLWPVFYSVHLYSDLTRLEFELESQHKATAVQLFENETSPIFSGEEKEKEENCYMLPTAPPAEQRAVGKRIEVNWSYMVKFCQALEGQKL